MICNQADTVHATYHTTLQKSPGQLVFGRDMIFNIKHQANWEYIQNRKQDIINQNNQRENARRIPHQYNVGDKVLLHLGDIKTKFDSQYSGPHKIVQVNNNGTVRIQQGPVTETVIIHPYKE